MSENGTRGKASDFEQFGIVVEGIADLLDQQKEQSEILTQLQARPIVELNGIERRLDEYADALERLKQAQQPARPRRRPWWITAALVSLAYVVGACSLYGVLLWRSRQVIVTKQVAPAVVQTPAKKGR